MSDTRHFMDRPLVQLTLVRFREFIREPEAVFWVFVFPILLATGLGIAFGRRTPDAPRIGVVRTANSAATLAALQRAPGMRVELLDDSTGARLLRTGDLALLVVPTGPRSVEYRYDRARDDARSARVVVDAAVQRAAGRTDPVAVQERTISDRGSRYIDFVIPGLLGMNLMGSGIWGLGFAIVTARSKKLLKRLAATPMSRAEYLLSFLLSRLVFLVLEVVTLLAFGVLAFGVPVRGPWSVLALISVFAAFSFSALGLLIASRARTTEGVSGLMNLVMLPMWIFSGVFFSSANFPAVIQPVIRVLPLTAVNDALRANMLQGAGLGSVLPQLAIIAMWMVASFLFALRLFRWR